MTFRRLLLAALLFFGAAATSSAANTRGEWVNRLKQLGMALHTYHDAHQRLPADFAQFPGAPAPPGLQPHLSWRVGILPFLEQDMLYMEFDFAKSWDSPTNKRLLTKPETRNVYANVFHVKRCKDSAGVVMPRGRGTFWGDGGQRTLKDVKGDPARTILLIEAAEDAAPVWSEPRDLIFDPAHPRKGLGWHWQSGFPGERGCFAVFADGEVRLLSGALTDDQLRQLFSGECTEALTLNWREAMEQMPFGWGIAPTMLIGLGAGLGGLAVAWRIIRARAASPTEYFWLILGMEYLVFLGVFVATYEYPLVSEGYRGNPSMYGALVLPARLVGCAMCTLVLTRLAKTPEWWSLFVVYLVLLMLATVDAASPDWNRRPEHALVTMPAPFVTALAGLGAVLLTRTKGAGAGVSRFAHWSGILVCFVPLVWICIWLANGYVVPTQWFLRVRD